MKENKGKKKRHTENQSSSGRANLWKAAQWTHMLETGVDLHSSQIAIFLSLSFLCNFLAHFGNEDALKSKRKQTHLKIETS